MVQHKGGQHERFKSIAPICRSTVVQRVALSLLLLFAIESLFSTEIRVNAGLTELPINDPKVLWKHDTKG
jgi:hypothetical protein